MNTEATYEVVSADSDATESLAERVGRACKGGEIFELIGDLGAGKTCFVRGLARGLGITEDVTSPSFALNNIYKGTSLSLQHFDFYRLSEAGVMAEEFKEAVFDPANVIAVEWGNVVHDILPPTHVTVNIAVLADDNRQVVFRYPDKLAYIFKDLMT